MTPQFSAAINSHENLVSTRSFVLSKYYREPTLRAGIFVLEPLNRDACIHRHAKNNHKFVNLWPILVFEQIPPEDRLFEQTSWAINHPLPVTCCKGSIRKKPLLKQMGVTFWALTLPSTPVFEFHFNWSKIGLSYEFCWRRVFSVGNECPDLRYFVW